MSGNYHISHNFSVVVGIEYNKINSMASLMVRNRTLAATETTTTNATQQMEQCQLSEI